MLRKRKPAAASEEGIGMWNTGLSSLTNNTGGTIYFTDLEDERWTWTLADGEVLVNGPKFPWCENSLEVRDKAFRIHDGIDANAPVLLHMFQNYRDDTCYYIKPGPTKWTDRLMMGEGPSSYLAVVIGSNKIPVATAAAAAIAPEVMTEEDFAKEQSIALR